VSFRLRLPSGIHRLLKEQRIEIHFHFTLADCATSESLKVTVATCLAFRVSVNNCAVANMLTSIVEHRTALGR